MNSRTGVRARRNAPLLGSDIVLRDRLMRLLQWQRPVVLFVAPAGYGKTTLMADWLRRTGRASAWLSLRATDDGLTLFLASLIGDLDARFVGACPATRNLLNGATVVPVPDLARQLAGEIERLPESFVLVLDDYHLIHDPQVHLLIGELLQVQPANLTLALASRHDPPLPLPWLRASNKLTELRTRELRFSHEETFAFLDAALDGDVQAADVDALDALVEGWPAGLRMAALLMQRDRAAAATSLPLELSSQLAMEYLASEVFELLPEEQREFLARTAILEQVSASLSASLVDGCSVEKCQSILGELARSQMFVFSLDGEGQWYRFHHLLRSLMLRRSRERLGPEGPYELHLRAARWFAAHGQLDVALDHTIQSGNVQAVADFVRTHRQAVLAHGEWSQVAVWKQLIPRAMMLHHPQLLILEAWHASHRGSLPELMSQLDAVEILLGRVALEAEEEQLLRCEVDALRCQGIFWKGDHAEAVRLGLRALAGTPLNYERTRGTAAMFGITSIEILGGSAEADARLTACLEEARHAGHSGYAVYCLMTMCFLRWLRADMVTFPVVLDQLEVITEQAGHFDGLAAFWHLRGCMRYMQNDLNGALEDFGAVVDKAYVAPANLHAQSVIGLAATLQALARNEEAIQITRAGIAYHKAMGNSRFVLAISAHLALLDLRQGRTSDALRWLAMPSPMHPQMPMPNFGNERLYRIQVLIGLGTQEGIEEAEEMLAALASYLQDHTNVRVQIEYWALQAVCLSRAGAEAEALDLLERAVVGAAAGNALRLLADLDYLIGPLLDSLAARGRSRTHVLRIRRAATVFAPSTLAPSVRQGPPAPVPAQDAPATNGNGAQSAGPRILTLEETLTARELEVLQLLEKDRPTNREIAKELFVTVETVKRHMNHIFQKLHVENRRQAIVEARRRGLLPPP
ncbi:MAG: LuxR C-terminal-related transcriptional regulator [Caldilineaceae bacterium]